MKPVHYTIRKTKTSLIWVLFLVFAVPAWSQTPINQDTLDGAYSDFSSAVANALPTAATLGHGWSDSYIGTLFADPPHLGVAVSLGATLFPYPAFASVFSDLGVAASLPDEITAFADGLGIPMPAYTVEVRVGGILLPFDVGMKAGALDRELARGVAPDSAVEAEYLVFGGDLRFAVVEETDTRPDVTIGAGYNFARGSFFVPGLFPSGVTVGGDSYDNPDVVFRWVADTIDLEARLSKRLLIFSPYLGVGGAVTFGRVGGGLAASGSSVDGAFADYEVTGGQVHVLGGFSVDIAVISIDLGIQYNLIGGALNGVAGIRFQM